MKPTRSKKQALLPKDASPEIRELYRPEPVRKTWISFERRLVNLLRKVSYRDKFEVLGFAETLAVSRIRARLTRRVTP